MSLRRVRAGAPTALATSAVLLLSAPVGATASQDAARVACPPDLEVLIERPFADRERLAVGNRILVRGAIGAPSCTARIAGIFDPPPDPARLTVDRPRVLFHLPQLERLTGREGEVDQFTVRLARGARASSVARRLEGFLPGTQVLSTAEVAGRSSTTFEVVSRFHEAIGLITLVAGGVFLACIMILKVQERRAPVAAARLVGIPRRTLLGWTVAEAALVSMLGGLIGILLGYAASAIINAVYQRAYETSLVFSRVAPDIIWRAVALALVLGMAAGTVAGLRLFANRAVDEVGR